MHIVRTSSRGRERLTKSVRLCGGWGVKVKCTYIIHARNRKKNRALTTTISFIREEVNDNNADNDFYVILTSCTTDISYNSCAQNAVQNKIVTPYSKRVIVSHMSGIMYL
jgi:hypothetical protein